MGTVTQPVLIKQARNAGGEYAGWASLLPPSIPDPSQVSPQLLPEGEQAPAGEQTNDQRLDCDLSSAVMVCVA